MENPGRFKFSEDQPKVPHYIIRITNPSYKLDVIAQICSRIDAENSIGLIHLEIEEKWRNKIKNNASWPITIGNYNITNRDDSIAIELLENNEEDAKYIQELIKDIIPSEGELQESINYSEMHEIHEKALDDIEEKIDGIELPQEVESKKELIVFLTDRIKEIGYIVTKFEDIRWREDAKEWEVGFVLKNPEWSVPVSTVAILHVKQK